jgi:phytoene/squalene synthetase
VVASSNFHMADRVLNGRLRQVLAELYLVTRSWEEVSRRLYADHGIRVTGQTLRRWNGELGISDAVEIGEPA